MVLGATSGIGSAIARELATRGYPLVLTGRREEEVGRIVADLTVRYRVPVRAETFDALEVEEHGPFLRRAFEKEGGLEGLVVCFGLLGDQATATRDFTHAREILDVNYTGAVSILTHAASLLEERGHGFIVGIGSVAGDRGRQSNYVYGSAKAGLSAFLQGLRNRLHGVSEGRIHVLTVKPGIVDTKMTYGLAGGRLAARPEHVARKIVNAMERRRNVVYVPGFWRPIMLLIRAIPEALFKRMKL